MPSDFDVTVAPGASRRTILVLTAASALAVSSVPHGVLRGLGRSMGYGGAALGGPGLLDTLQAAARPGWFARAGAVPRRLQSPPRHAPAVLADWEAFKRRFTAPDGRVCDTGNGNVSHSEGQGWGMMLAVAFDDRAFFDTLHDWTRRNLQVRADALHAWRYVPQSAVPVADHNNATDGDLFIAAGLWRAAWRWQEPGYARAAGEIARDILDVLVRKPGGRTVLLPGAVGFERADSVTINPSYHVIPVIEELAALQASPQWSALLSSGQDILAEGRFGAFRLPPDWLRVDQRTGALSPDPSRPARFSYDAIRIPLWLAWSKAGPAAPAQDFLAYWQRYQPQPPAWVDLTSNRLAGYPAPAGMLAIGQIASVLSAREAKPGTPAALPALSASIDYYSAALTLLSHCALQESVEA